MASIPSLHEVHNLHWLLSCKTVMLYSLFAIGEIYWCVSTSRSCPATLLALYS